MNNCEADGKGTPIRSPTKSKAALTETEDQNPQERVGRKRMNKASFGRCFMKSSAIHGIGPLACILVSFARIATASVFAEIILVDRGQPKAIIVISNNPTEVTLYRSEGKDPSRIGEIADNPEWDGENSAGIGS